MSTVSLLAPSDLDVALELPLELVRLVAQNVVDLTPWQVMPRELAIKRIRGLRERYCRKYAPFAYRQDNDDLACIDPRRK